MRLIICWILVALTMIPSWVSAAESGRPKVGLVLSGGGARGAAHIGVLKVLEEQRIPIDFIAGTSMGSIVGGLYASGLTAAEIEGVYQHIDWQDVFADQPERLEKSYRRKRDDDLYLIATKPGISTQGLRFPTGLIQGEKFELILRRATRHVSDRRDFNQLPIPFRCVATDIATGEPVVFDAGDLPTALRASMAVPGLFAAVREGQRLLVDGGLANNLPVDVVRRMGADVVIAVDISTPLKTQDQINDLISITDQLTNFLTRNNTEQQIESLEATDTLIIPSLGNLTASDFQRGTEAIAAGARAAEDAVDQLARLSLAPQAYQEHLAARPGIALRADKRLGFIRIEGDSELRDEVILSRMNVKAGDVIDLERIEADVRMIYGLDLYELVNYRLLEEDGETGLLINARKKSWGPQYLQFGMTLDSTLDGDNSYNFALGYLKTEMNPLGGELRANFQVGEEPELRLEYYQPLSHGSPFYVLPRVRFGRENFNLFQDDRRVAEFRVTSADAELGIGREFSTWADLRFGLRFFTSEGKVITGQSPIDRLNFDGGEYFASFTIDRLDNLDFPRQGIFSSLQLNRSLQALGASEDFDQLVARFNGAYPLASGALLLGAEFGSTVDGEAALPNRFRLGGFLRLSGFAVDQLSGQHFGLVRSAYLHRLAGLNIVPIYIGASLEAGNVWEQESDVSFDDLVAAGSLFLGLDSPVGPVYLGFGLADSQQEALFFYLGRTF